MESITSRILGEIKKDIDSKDSFTSKPVFIPLFNKELEVEFDFYNNNDSVENFIKDADKALEEFLTQKPDNKITTYIYKECKESIEYFERDEYDDETWRKLWDLKSKDKYEIWNHFTPLSVSLVKREKEENDKNIYVLTICDCDWEEEHGLQIVYKKGKKICYVGPCEYYILTWE